jgi:hypothetical protein
MNLLNSVNFIIPQIVGLLDSNKLKVEIFKTMNSLVKTNYPPKNFIALIISYLYD